MKQTAAVDQSRAKIVGLCASAIAGMAVLQRQHRQAASKLAQQQFEMDHAWSACRILFWPCNCSHTC